MKKLILLFTAFLWLSPVYAQWNTTTVNTIYLELASGKTESIGFKAYPPTFFVFEDDKLVFYANDKSYVYEINDVVKMYTDVSIPTTIDNMTASSRIFHVAEESVALSGFDANEPVRIYTIDGHEYLSLRTSERGELKISCSKFSQGVSIIKTRNQSIKVIIK